MLGNALKTRPPRIPASWKAVLTDNIGGLATSTATIIREEWQ